MDGAEFLGDVVVPGYELYDLGHYPGACPGAGSVVGELYELASPAVLDVLDEAEGVHQKPQLYRRVLVDAQGIPAWFYVYARHVDGGEPVHGGLNLVPVFYEQIGHEFDRQRMVVDDQDFFFFI